MICVSFIPFFVSLFLVTFGDEDTKILCNLCLHFARQDRQDGKKRKENHATKVTKTPKTKRRKYGTNETLTAFLWYNNSSESVDFRERFGDHRKG